VIELEDHYEYSIERYERVKYALGVILLQIRLLLFIFSFIHSNLPFLEEFLFQDNLWRLRHSVLEHCL